ncbi:MAG TPA: hypothetical protein VKR54_01920 [Candidatus Babeliales bacterium]|nr:hypothetical protein [Candidatus Babeliales bacterium]
MPKIICTCQNILSYSEIPCPIEYKFISDCDYDKYQEMIDTEFLYQQMNSFLKCPQCERLWIFWHGYNNHPTEYMKKELNRDTKHD